VGPRICSPNRALNARVRLKCLDKGSDREEGIVSHFRLQLSKPGGRAAIVEPRLIVLKVKFRISCEEQSFAESSAGGRAQDDPAV
jgi:hypothetical protein